MGRTGTDSRPALGLLREAAVENIDRDDLLVWLRELQRVYAENRDYLTELDAAIGDADHGINMDRGFTAVVKGFEQRTPPDMPTVLKTVAMVLIKTVGGASGPLYGTFFLRAAGACPAKPELAAADVATLFDAGTRGVIERGKAQPGDKTMVDALLPAANAMRQAATDGAAMEAMLQTGAAAAESGMRQTIGMQARKGRASYLAERSIGHQDPGATSAFLMVRAAARIWGD